MAYFIKSERNADKLVAGGYVYTKDRTRENRSYWRCEKFKV